MFYGDIDNSGEILIQQPAKSGSANFDVNQLVNDLNNANGSNNTYSTNNDTCIDCIECQPYGIAGYLLGLIAFGTLVPKFFGGVTRATNTKKKIAKTSDIDKKLKSQGTVIRKSESKKAMKQLSNYRKAQKNDNITINVN